MYTGGDWHALDRSLCMRFQFSDRTVTTGCAFDDACAEQRTKRGGVGTHSQSVHVFTSHLHILFLVALFLFASLIALVTQDATQVTLCDVVMPAAKRRRAAAGLSTVDPVTCKSLAFREFGFLPPLSCTVWSSLQS